jgi:putative ABC transport system substrate-binding protein
VDAARLIAAAVLGLFLAASAQAQAPSRPLHVGFLSQVARTSPNFVAFRQGLEQLGWVEGRNVTLTFIGAEDRVDRLRALAEQLVRQNVDVIVATAIAIEPAKLATRTIPIVFVTGDDPIAAGFVESLGRPGGNVTGLTSLNRELEAKRLALLKEAVPTVKRAAVLVHPDFPMTAAETELMERNAAALGLRLQVVEARGGRELDTAVAGAKRAGADALMLTASPFFSHQRRLAQAVSSEKLPAMVPWRQFVEAGGLISYGADIPELFRRAAGYVDRIAKGTKPGEMPVEQAVKFEMVVNLKAARALGVTIPQSVIFRADEVIQ